MTSRPRIVAFALGLFLSVGLAAAVLAQPQAAEDDIARTRRAIVEAERQGEAARARAEKLEAEAAVTTEAAERTAREAAAVAARIQQAEAEIARQEEGIRAIAEERRALADQLARRQQPLVRLTAALQRLSRRPPALALLRPGSVRDTMYMRALLETMLPEVERHTAALRSDIEKGRALERRALAAARELRASHDELKKRRAALVALETRQRLDFRRVSGAAARESDRALALAEQAKDLEALVEEIGRMGALREELARLPGPIIRPAQPASAQVVAQAPADPAEQRLATYILPLSGRVVTGFGEASPGEGRSRGIALAARAGAQAVAPAPGRVVFAGPYRGYENIVIIEHGGGWMSLVTGLAQLDAHVSEQLVAGSPLGVAGAGEPVVTLELRRDGIPVNPLQYVTGL